MHVIPDHPGSAPDKAFFLENVDYSLWWTPAFFYGCHEPVVGSKLFLPAPVDDFLVVAFWKNIHGQPNAVKGAALGISDCSPGVSVGAG